MTDESRKAFEAAMIEAYGIDPEMVGVFVGRDSRTGKYQTLQVAGAWEGYSARDAEIEALKEQLDAQIELSQQLAGERDGLKARVDRLERTPAERAIALYDQIQTLPPSSRQAMFSRLAAMPSRPDVKKQ